MRKWEVVILIACCGVILVGLLAYSPAIDGYRAVTSDAVAPSLPDDGSRWEVKRSFILAADEEALEYSLPPLIHDEPDVLDSLISEDRIIYLEPGDVVEVVSTYHPPSGVAISRVRYRGDVWFCLSLHFGAVHAKQID